MIEATAALAGRTADRRLWRCIVVLATVGFLLRAGFAVLWPTIHRPDETFQNLEPAYRLLTGWGVVSWEWREGIRSWMFPDALYAVMTAARLLHLPLLPTISVSLSAVATSGVIIAILVGWRREGLAGAVLCGTLFAIWPDLVYFGPKPLLEVQAGALLAAAAGLASLDRPRTTLRMAAIGALLGLAFDLRFQLAPALAVVAIGAAWRDVRGGWIPLLAAAALTVLLLGVIDLASLGSPFQSIWKNVEINFFLDRAQLYGVEPFYWYGLELVRRYGVASIPLALCFGLGIRRAPLLAATAVMVVAFHSLIAHKEISFIYAALPCALIVAGLGAARLLQALPRSSGAALAVSVLLCAVTAAFAGQAGRPFLEPSAQTELRAIWSIVRTRTDICGIGLYGNIRFPWVFTPGYVGLERHVPLYLLQGPAALTVVRPAFNYLVVDTAAEPVLPDGERVSCSGKFCLIHREQRCEPDPSFVINAAIARLNQ